MIPRIATTCQTPSWQKQLAEAITDVKQLFSKLHLPTDYLDAAIESSRLFPFKLPQSYLARIEKGNINDPLLRQVLPLVDEQFETAGYTTDPVGDSHAAVVPGLLHKYQGRVLLMPTSACALHCRYCFRRHFPYSDHISSNNWRQAIDYIEKDSSVSEVILSGGDPLSLNNNKLFRLLDLLAPIPHLKRIRFHTRLPIVLPDRIDSELTDYLHSYRCKVVVVVHCNHPNEITAELAKPLNLLNNNNITLLNQSVLLAGVNDNKDTLCELSERLFENNILPYYLHQLDKAQGTQHFAVSEAHANRLVNQLRNSLPGYLVPRLVRENAGEPAKQILF